MEQDDQIRVSTELTDVSFSRSASDFLKAARLSSILGKVIERWLEYVVVGCYLKKELKRKREKSCCGLILTGAGEVNTKWNSNCLEKSIIKKLVFIKFS